jgi:hypothetical protein
MSTCTNKDIVNFISFYFCLNETMKLCRIRGHDLIYIASKIIIMPFDKQSFFSTSFLHLPDDPRYSSTLLSYQHNSKDIHLNLLFYLSKCMYPGLVHFHSCFEYTLIIAQQPCYHGQCLRSC